MGSYVGKHLYDSPYVKVPLLGGGAEEGVWLLWRRMRPTKNTAWRPKKQKRIIKRE